VFEMRIPVEEGRQYRLGEFEFEGVTVPTVEDVRAQFELAEGDYYNETEVRNGIERLQLLYGASGYMEFLAFPDLSPRDQRVDEDGLEVPTGGPAIVDVMMRAEEGDQYFVNRITFAGNRTTRDYVVRREFRLLEAGVYNSNALTTSVRRINQLGYFLPIQEDDVIVEQVEGDEFQVDIEVPLEEQNRNQVSFGAGVSQFEGFFGQASFQTKSPC
jgi:outer membrane protein insertion porin family